MYRGKDQERAQNIPATVFPVIKLIMHEDYHNKGEHVLGTDQWYTQLMVLTRMMDIIGIDVVGTVKTNRRGLHQECKFPKKGRNMKTKEGEMKCMEASMPLSNGTFGPVYMVLAWMDSKPVHLLSIFPPFQVAMRRLQPSAIPVYNSAMCGTDLEDQNASYYDARKRVWRWQHRLSTTYPPLYHCAQLPANKMNSVEVQDAVDSGLVYTRNTQ